RGVFLTAREAARSLGMALEDIRVAVQGFGNVGGVAAELMAQAKARVVAVQDHTGSLYKADGLDIAALSRHAREHGGIAGFTGGDAIGEEDFWGVDCDLLIPAALEGQLDGPRAERIRARLVVEGANGPINRRGDEVLLDRGITVVLDVIANAGGVIVSYFEWVQDFSSFFWTEAEINQRLDQILTGAFAHIWDTHVEHGVSLRTAAFIVACRRVLRARAQRGLYP